MGLRIFEKMSDAGNATGAYVNYIDPLQHDWHKVYYGDNYQRLLTIKKKIDPNNYFNFQQSTVQLSTRLKGR